MSSSEPPAGAPELLFLQEKSHTFFVKTAKISMTFCDIAKISHTA